MQHLPLKVSYIAPHYGEVVGCSIRQRKFIKSNSANDDVCHSRMDTWTLRYRRPWMIEVSLVRERYKRADKLLSSVQTKTDHKATRTHEHKHEVPTGFSA
ncbi:hypothetical protein BDN71DRAFT_1439349 [Pleurotus eryngii]|uniref:Uncharacterized protein n=1 Tax=Pleurotus eryngii TaxID=5323 RepID=A0A9P6A6Z5_PLEER|nr:hypothetical protein BDN71DRAFT_1439349 [Pleurotus eryngii]